MFGTEHPGLGIDTVATSDERPRRCGVPTGWMITFELELLAGWDEQAASEALVAFVRDMRRFPDYNDFVSMHQTSLRGKSHPLDRMPRHR